MGASLNASIVWSAVLSDTADPVGVGDALIDTESGWILATAANLAAYSRTLPDGFSLDIGNAGQSIRAQTGGYLDPAVTGIGATSQGYAEVNAGARLTRTASASAITVGRCNPRGGVALGSGSPGATGQGGHTVKANNAALTQRDNLDFDGFTFSGVDVGGDTTRIKARHIAKVVAAFDYGALGDNSTDDYAAIKDGLDAISAATPAGAVLDMGTGVYKISHPIRVKASYSGIVGQSRAMPPGTNDGGQSTIRGDGTWWGPAIVGAPDLTPVAVQAFKNSVLSAGKALAMDSAGNVPQWWIDLSDAGPVMEGPFRRLGSEQGIHGAAALTAETFFQVDTLPGSEVSHLFCSAGTLSTLETTKSRAFGFKLFSDGTMSAFVNVGGTTYASPTSSAITTGHLYHAAVVYDGANVSFFLTDVDGVSNGSAFGINHVGDTPATGTVVKAWTECVTIGAEIRGEIETVEQSSGWEGAIECVGLYTYAKYTALSTPTRGKLDINPAGAPSTASILVVWNCDLDTDDPDLFTVGHCYGGVTNGGPGGINGPLAYLRLHTNAVGFDAIEDLTIERLSIDHTKGVAIDVVLTSHSTFRDLYLQGPFDGIRLSNYANFYLVENVFVASSDRWAMANTLEGIGEYRSLHLRSCAAGLGMTAKVSVDGAFIDVGAFSKVGAFFSGGAEADPVTVDRLYVSTEDLVALSGQEFRSSIVLSGIGGADFTNCTIPCNASDVPFTAPVEVLSSSSLGNISFHTCRFTVDADTTALVVYSSDVHSAVLPGSGGKPCILFDNCAQSGTRRPWVSATGAMDYRVIPSQAGTAVMVPLASTQAITFAVTEPDADYDVVFAAQSPWPSAFATAVYSQERSTTGFTIVAEPAIPAASSLGISWELRRGRRKQGDVPPTQISDVVFFLYGPDAAVDSWPDRTGNGHNAAKVGGTADATLDPTSADLNNQPAIIFDGVTNAFVIPATSATLIGDGAKVTLYIIGTDFTADNGFVVWGDALVRIQSPSGKPRFYFGLDNIESTIDVTDGAAHIIECVWSQADNYASIRVDNEAAVTSTAGAGFGSGNPVGICGDQNANFQTAATLAAVWWLGRRATSDELSLMRAWANAEYGVTI